MLKPSRFAFATTQRYIFYRQIANFDCYFGRHVLICKQKRL